MVNRIDIAFDDADFAAIQQFAEQFTARMNTYLLKIEPTKKKEGQAMGEGLALLYVQKAFEILNRDRTIVHASELDYAAFKRDIEALDKLLALRDTLGGTVGRMQSNLVLLGKDLMDQANTVLSALKRLKKDDETYGKWFNELNFLYESRASQAESTRQFHAELAQKDAALAEKDAKIAALAAADGK